MSTTMLITEEHLNKSTNNSMRVGMIYGFMFSMIILTLFLIGIALNREDVTNDLDRIVMMESYTVTEDGNLILVHQAERTLRICRFFQNEYDDYIEEEGTGLITRCLEIERN